MKKDKVLALLNSQMLEIVTLITLEAIELRTQKDKGRLNNLHRALKINQIITKTIKDEN